jgi:hypothetical protein
MGYIDHTAFERMHKAIECLAISAAPLQTRLGFAALDIIVLDSRDFREGDERDLYTGVKDGLTTAGDVATTTSGLSDAQAEAVAGDILGLYFSVIDGYNPGPDTTT